MNIGARAAWHQSFRLASSNHRFAGAKGGSCPASSPSMLWMWSEPTSPYYVILVFGVLACLEGQGIGISKTFLTLGGTGISLLSLATFLAFTGLVVIGSQLTGRWVDQRALNRNHFDEGLRYAIGRITYYVLLATGLMAALQTIGIQLGSLTVLIGALGVGIGLYAEHRQQLRERPDPADRKAAEGGGLGRSRWNFRSGQQYWCPQHDRGDRR